MDKPTKKTREIYNPNIISQLMEKYGVKINAVQKAIRGERTSVTAIAIQKEYRALEAAANKTIENKIKKD